MTKPQKAPTLDRTGRLVLLRHGSTAWNEQNRFTGWADIPLSRRGITEANRAGRLLAGAGVLPDVSYTSALTRAIQTATIALNAANRPWVDVHRSWRLNERHYGALQGRNREDALAEYGQDQLQFWRRSYRGAPPPSVDFFTASGCKYGDEGAALPRTESLKDVCERILPYWKAEVETDLRRGRTVLVVAHSNSLRAIVKNLERRSAIGIVNLNIPIAVPLVYAFEGALEAGPGNYLIPESPGMRRQQDPGPLACGDATADV